MRNNENATDGFSLVEVIIAMFLLGIAAIVLIPLLVQGINVASQQSSTATATRRVSALMDSARTYPTCANIASLLPQKSYKDSVGRLFTVVGTQTPSDPSGLCVNNSTVKLTFTATSSSGKKMTSLTALVFVPPLATPSATPTP